MKKHQKNSMKNKLAILAVLGAVAIGAYFVYANRFEIQQDLASSDVPEAVTFEEVVNRLPETGGDEPVPELVEYRSNTTDSTYIPEPEPVSEPVAEADSTVNAVNLAVPFTSQAPHGNWSLPYQEACEEASVLMAVSYFDSNLVDLSTPSSADAAILDIVKFQVDEYQLYLDTTAEETARFANAKFPGYYFNVIYDPTVEVIKTSLTNGSPVLVPAAGRKLGNPFFTGDGPPYHMILVRGFTESSFVTNDPGTRHGEGYVYSQDVIMNAMGDWNNGDPGNGRKAIIVVTKR